MSQDAGTAGPHPGVSGRVAPAVAVLVAAVIAVAGLLWAKWLPYGDRIGQLAGGGSWTGSDVLTAGGVRAGDPPSWTAAWSFTTAYLAAVWKALVAALLISAALQALVPRDWLLRLLDRPGHLRPAVVGAAVSTPTMMCTCCTAPVAVGLRRSGVPTAAAVAYWLGNPLLNPAVLAFLAFVAPWQWTATRAVVGVLVAVGGAAVVARFTDRRRTDVGEPAPAADPGPPPAPPRRFARALARTGLVLVPEYLVVVLLVGAFRGWLLEFGPGAAGSVLAVVLAAAVGTLLVIPTAGEIPVLQGLALAGASTGVLGALLVTLPAVSLPGMAMVGRALGWRATLATAGVAALGGLAGAGLLVLL